jgi:hypothetical protein
VTTYTPTGSTQLIDFSQGAWFVVNLGSATNTVTVSFTNAIPGASYFMQMVQGATPRNCTFPANTVQAGGGGTTYTASGTNATDGIAIGFRTATNAVIAVTTGYQ